MVNEHVFWEAEGLAAFVRNARFEIVIKARSDGPSALRSLASPQLTLNDCRLTPPLSTVGTIADDTVAVGVPLVSAETWRVDGRPFNDGILFAVPQREYFMTTSGAVRFLTLQMSDEGFRARWRLLIGSEWQPVGGLLPLSPDERRRFRALAERMVGFMSAPNAVGYPPLAGDSHADDRFSAAWQSVFLDATVLAVAGSQGQAPRLTAAATRRIMTNALDCIRRYPCGSPSVGELCDVCITNERSLRQAFLRTVGVGPCAYLRLRRLHLARRVLSRSAAPPASVASVATDHGFFDLGRFAGDYRQLFGELPSATLRRR